MEKVFTLNLIAVLFSATLFAQTSQKLTVSINGIKNKGTLMIGLYNKSDGFGKSDKTFKNQKVYVSSNSIQVSWNDLPKGKYAVAIFQDLNNNGKLDKNILGKPKEPYAFSNNIQPVFSAPTFDDCQFDLNDSQAIEVTLIN